jgi:uncharacterized protein YdhG (YjbR/CyaY superfamily)
MTDMIAAKSANIDEFILNFPQSTQKLMQQIRMIIQDAAPEAAEKISYGIPTFYLNGNLVHFSAYKNHLGFYPGASAIKVFAEELSKYETSKGTVQFPLDKKLPHMLITKIVKFRVKENMQKAKSKAKKK